MNNFNKSLLSVFMISLFSLVSIQSINKLVGSNSSNVLGESTSNLIAANSCNNGQRQCNGLYALVCQNGTWITSQYCGPNGTCQGGYCVYTPTQAPVPTTSCKSGVNTFSVYESCGANLYRYAKVVCYDGYQTTLGGPTSCKDSPTWQNYAQQTCVGRSNCQNTPTPSARPTLPANPTPTTASVGGVPCGVILPIVSRVCQASSPTATPTAIQYPTLTPTRAPTAAPTWVPTMTPAPSPMPTKLPTPSESCTSGSRMCQVNNVYLCTGNRWMFLQSCPSNQICLNGYCVNNGGPTPTIAAP